MDQRKLIHIQTFGQTFSNSPNEKFLLMILCSQAKLENDNKSINVKRGLRARVEMGLWPCKPPTGYTKYKRMDQKCESVMEKIFGSNHQYVKELFDIIEDNISLVDLRNKLAHGDSTLLSKKDEEIILKKVYILEGIVEALIKKLLLKPGEDFPKWSGSFTATLDMSDPRGTMVTSDINMLGGRKDWRIRPEWFN